jgi:hypothetical protein
MATRTEEPFHRLPTPAEIADAAGVTPAEIEKLDPATICHLSFELIREQPERFEAGVAILEVAE